MGKVITFAQQKGGSGKTTLLVHLAHSWFLAGRKVAVIDLDPQQSLTRWLRLGALPEITEIESKNYRALADIRQASRDHDIVLVDCPGNASNLLEAAIRSSSLVLVPCQPSTMDVWATDAIVKMAAKERIHCAVVMNRVPARGSAAESAVRMLDAAKTEVLDARIGNRVAYASAFGKGHTALSMSGNSIAKQEIEALRNEIEAFS